MDRIRQARLAGVSNKFFPVSVQDISFQLQRFVTVMARYHADSKQTIEPTKGLFPIDVDLSQVNFFFWLSVNFLVLFNKTSGLRNDIRFGISLPILL